MTNIKEALEDFFNNTTVHGFQYLSSNYHICKKLFWIIWICLGIYGSSTFVLQTIKDSYENPVMTSTEYKSISKYPFPAVTIDSGKIIVKRN